MTTKVVNNRHFGDSVCPICGSEFVKYMETQETCGAHACTVRNYQNKLLDQGLCVSGDGNKIDTKRSESYCTLCLDKAANKKRQLRQKNRDFWDDEKKCAICDTPFTPVREKQRTCGKSKCTSEQTRRNRIAAGICVRCDEPISKNSTSRCDKCLEIARKQQEERNKKKKLRNFITANL